MRRLGSNRGRTVKPYKEQLVLRLAFFSSTTWGCVLHQVTNPAYTHATYSRYWHHHGKSIPSPETQPAWEKHTHTSHSQLLDPRFQRRALICTYSHAGWPGIYRLVSTSSCRAGLVACSSRTRTPATASGVDCYLRTYSQHFTEEGFRKGVGFEAGRTPVPVPEQ